MRAAVDEEGRQVAAERRRRVVDGEHGERQVVVPVVLAAVGVGAQRVADDAVVPLHLGVGVLVVRRAVAAFRCWPQISSESLFQLVS